mgnify:CR=1 FL=1
MSCACCQCEQTTVLFLDDTTISLPGLRQGVNSLDTLYIRLSCTSFILIIIEIDPRSRFSLHLNGELRCSSISGFVFIS